MNQMPTFSGRQYPNSFRVVTYKQCERSASRRGESLFSYSVIDQRLGV